MSSENTSQLRNSATNCNSNMTNNRKRSACGCLLQLAAFGLLLVGCVAVVSYFYLGTPNPTGFFEHDTPPNATDASRWDSSAKQKGLKLSIVNALDDSWGDIFEEYVGQWDQTDALELTTRKVTADSKCDPLFRELKVCNGDYGPTDWKGININLIRNGYIIQGISQMNDYFLSDTTEAERKYTMCHEIGHGFGLPHTDENYDNRNRGDCLDYTNAHSTNLQPGTFNYDLLVELYGTIPPRRELIEDDDRLPESIEEKYLSLSKQMAEPDHHCEDGVCVEDIVTEKGSLAMKVAKRMKNLDSRSIPSLSLES